MGEDIAPEDEAAYNRAAELEAQREAQKAKKKEDHWLKSILGCPLCRGKEVLACYGPCREAGGGMGKCLAGCMTNNPLVLEMMLKMMPAEKAPPQAEAKLADVAEAALD